MTKLSIITICFNEPNVEETCKSILSQTWQDFEWIVIDGGSNKETLDIFEKYKHRIDKFISEPDNGVYDAFNKGIRMVSGEYINFLNAGDSYSDKSILEKVFDKKEYSEDILYGNEYFLDRKTNKKHLKKMPRKVSVKFLISNTLRHQSSFIKRKLFDELGLYDEEYKIVADWEKWLVFALNNKSFKYLPFAIADFDTSGMSFSYKNYEIHQKEKQQILHKYFDDKELKKLQNSDLKLLSQKIFSIKNSDDKKFKIITVLGVHIKIKKGS